MLACIIKKIQRSLNKYTQNHSTMDTVKFFSPSFSSKSLKHVLLGNKQNEIRSSFELIYV